MGCMVWRIRVFDRQCAGDRLGPASLHGADGGRVVMREIRAESLSPTA